MLYPISERQAKGIFENWNVVCALSRMDKQESSILRRVKDGCWFLYIVFVEKKNG